MKTLLRLLLGISLSGGAAQAATFHSAEGRFSVDAPLPLQEKVTRDAEQTVKHEFRGTDENGGYTVTYYEPDLVLSIRDKDPYEVLEFFVGSPDANTHLVSETKLSLGEHPGLTAQFRVEPEGVTMHSRAFLVKGRVYVLTTIEFEADSARGRSFLDSFRVDGVQARATAISAAAAPAEILFTSPEAGFSVRTPVKLEEQHETKDGRTEWAFNSEKAGIKYAVIVWELGPEHVAGDNAKRLLSLALTKPPRERWTLVDKRAVAVGPLPGLEARLDASEGHPETMRKRGVIVGRRLYQVITVQNLNDDAATARRFLDSFRVGDAAAPASPAH